MLPLEILERSIETYRRREIIMDASIIFTINLRRCSLSWGQKWNRAGAQAPAHKYGQKTSDK